VTSQAETDEFLTVRQVAAELGVSLSRGYQIVRQVGSAPVPAGCLRSQLEAYLTQRQRSAETPSERT